MRVIVGLGNPGAEYQNTRHNAGILLIDKLTEKQLSDYGWRRFYGILVYKTPDLILVKTADYFMNESRNIIHDLERMDELKRFFLVRPQTHKESPCALYIAHDDLDIRLGNYKIQQGIGPKQHNGILSIEQALSSKDFGRIRIGIDNRAGELESKKAGEDYVLEKFSLDEKKILETVLENISDAILKTAN